MSIEHSCLLLLSLNHSWTDCNNNKDDLKPAIQVADEANFTQKQRNELMNEDQVVEKTQLKSIISASLECLVESELSFLPSSGTTTSMMRLLERARKYL